MRMIMGGCDEDAACDEDAVCEGFFGGGEFGARVRDWNP